MKESSNLQSIEYDSVIVGMGPVGLAAAYELAKKNKRRKILIIDRRPEDKVTLRSQMIVLDPARKYQLMQMIEKDRILSFKDLKFLDSLAASTEIKISAIQKFLIRRIKNLPNSEDVTFSYDTNLTQANLSEGSAVIRNHTKIDQTINFHHLIGADGAKANTLDVVRAGLTEPNIIYRFTPTDMQHVQDTYHLTAHVTLSRQDGNEFELPQREFLSSFLKVQEENGEKHLLYFLRFDAESFHRENKKKVDLGFVGEVPDEIYYDLQNDPHEHSQALAHVKKAIAQYLGVHESEFNIEIKKSKNINKEGLKLLSFQGSSMIANISAIEINGRTFYLLGDSYFTPNYAIGHGLNDGLEAAQAIGNLPLHPSQQEDNEKYKINLSNHMAEYNKLTAKNARIARLWMQGIHWFRKLGNLRNKVPFLLEKGVADRHEQTKIDLKKSLAHTVNDNMEDNIAATINHLLKKSVSIIDSGHIQQMGFLAVNEQDFKDENQLQNYLQNLSTKNGHIPIIIKRIDASDNLVYQIYGRSKKGVWELRNPDQTKIMKLIKNTPKLTDKMIFTERLQIVSPSSNIAFVFENFAFKFIRDIVKVESKHNNADYHYEMDKNNLSKLLENWRELITYPAITNQYRFEIQQALTGIVNLLEDVYDEKMKKDFGDLLNEFESVVNTHNKKLIKEAVRAPNKLDPSGRSPLYYALQHADVATIRTVLIGGANPNKAVEYGTIFSSRVFNEPAIARLLFQYGADPFKFAGASKKYNLFHVFTGTGREYNPKLAIEFLILAKNEDPVLAKKFQKNMSVNDLKKLVSYFKESNYSDWYRQYDFNEAYIKDTLQRFNNKGDTIANSLVVQNAFAKLIELTTETLEGVIKEKQKTFKYKITHPVDTLFRHRQAVNETLSEYSSTELKIKNK